MKTRICYAWFGEFANSVRAAHGGVPGEVELPMLPETEDRATLTHDGWNWKFIYPAPAAEVPDAGEKAPSNP